MTGTIMKKQKILNLVGMFKNMGGNILGGNFLGGNFPRGVCWVGIFRVDVFLIPRKNVSK